MTIKTPYSLKLPDALKSVVAVNAEFFLKLRAGKAKPFDMKSVLRKGPRREVVETDR